MRRGDEIGGPNQNAYTKHSESSQSLRRTQQLRNGVRRHVHPDCKRRGPGHTVHSISKRCGPLSRCWPSMPIIWIVRHFRKSLFLIQRVYAFFRLRQAGLAQHQAALINLATLSTTRLLGGSNANNMMIELDNRSRIRIGSGRMVPSQWGRTTAETIFIPNIGPDFVHIINETKQESLGQNVSTVGSEISMIRIILPFTIYVLGAWLQTQVDFPSYAIRLAPSTGHICNDIITPTSNAQNCNFPERIHAFRICDGITEIRLADLSRILVTLVCRTTTPLHKVITCMTTLSIPFLTIKLQQPHLTLAAFASCRSLKSYHHTRSRVQPSSRIGADTVTGTEGAHGGGNGDKLREVLISERVEMATSAFPELRSQSPLALWLAPKGNSSSPAGCQTPNAEVGLAEVGLGDYPTIVVVTTDDIKSLPTSVFGCLEHEVRAESQRLEILCALKSALPPGAGRRSRYIPRVRGVDLVVMASNRLTGTNHDIASAIIVDGRGFRLWPSYFCL
ncbi:hypothetical protein BC936DRAFT_140063 [Jimgerdemannia flammicorona]|uniref:Uncharacterized protein n=1 Tax=Jimgerdemannia flammicorona TaxID=994334 RepID=A0A433DH92_9FUNG|nr:hypothetical protein BC936DRAFT_140063 [Jimgerdemannia flammicorona]